MIPRILHQVWVGPQPLPAEYESYVGTWRKHHPEWEHHLWTEDHLPPVRLEESADPIRSPVERCDLLRLEVLWHFGGVYVDVDFECRQPIDPLLEDVEFATADLKPGRVNHAFMASVPEHPLIGRALEVVEPRKQFGYDKEATGPAFFNRVLREYGRDRIALIDRELIYPSWPGEEERAYAIHHQARTWKDAEGFKKAALLAEKRLKQTRSELEKTQATLAKVEAELREARAGSGRIRQILARARG